tara:strand:- start:67 stop:438 length:372 start_codon:yes stop_codon:yes gene_type:complete
MIKEYKDKWLKGLRSGKYNQTQKVLMSEAGFCCLGVLMNTYDSNGWVEADGGDMYHRSNKYGYTDSYDEGDELYGEASQDSELTSDTLSTFDISDDEQCHLIKMNDTKGNNFNEIADWIDENM